MNSVMGNNESYSESYWSGFAMASSNECDSEPILKELDRECPLCSQTLVIEDQFLTNCCKNRVCETCIKTTQENINQCSLCKSEPVDGTVDKEFQRLIDEQIVPCSQKEHGCSWVGKQMDLMEHLNNDTDGCQYVLTPCLECEKKVYRYKLQQHMDEECQLRAYACEYCNNYSSTYEDVTTQHYFECPDFLMPCPNRCTDVKFKRSKLDEHLLAECPDEVVSCRFSEMGCMERMKRSELQQHIEANVLQHQLVMCDTFKEIKKENEMLKRDHEELKALKSAQDTADYWIDGCKKMAEGVRETHWREYLTSLAVFSTNIPEPICPIIFKWSNYERMLNKSKDKGKFYYFRPFYTHAGGYKMQLRIYPSGIDHGKDTHISLYCHIMKGENDDTLKWPFEGIIEVMMLNQVEDDKHFVQEIWELQSLPYDVIRQPDSFQIRNESGWGKAQFVALSEVTSFSPHKQYLMNDCLYFKVIANTTK